MATTTLSKKTDEIAVLEKKEKQLKAAKEKGNELAIKKLKASIASLKEGIKEGKTVKDVTAKQLANSLLASRKKFLEMSKKDFNGVLKQLAKKPEYAFLKNYTREEVVRDIMRKAKPVGWRFKGRGDYRKPTPAQVRKGRADGTVYYENRPNRSDVSQTKQLEKGGYADSTNPKHVLHIDGQNWFLVKIDSTHFYMSNSPDFRGMAHHIGQHNGEPYYEEVREWLKTTTMSKGGSTFQGGGEIWFLKGVGKSGLDKIKKHSKENKNKLFIMTDDNYTNIGSFWVKNGNFAKRTVANPNYDLEKNKTSLRAKSDVIYKLKEYIADFEKGGSTYARGGTVIKKGNRVRVVNTKYNGKEGLVVSDDLHNGNYIVQLDGGNPKGFPFENLMLLSRETYQGGGEIKEVADAIFNSNSKRGKIETQFGDKTLQGLMAMIENDNYEPMEIARAIYFPNADAKTEKIETELGYKSIIGLKAMIDNARQTYQGGGVVHLYYGGEEADETVKASSEAEAEKIAMEKGAEHWDYVEAYAKGGNTDNFKYAIIVTNTNNPNDNQSRVATVGRKGDAIIMLTALQIAAKNAPLDYSIVKLYADGGFVPMSMAELERQRMSEYENYGGEGSEEDLDDGITRQYFEEEAYSYEDGGEIDINDLNIPVHYTMFEDELYEYGKGGGLSKGRYHILGEIKGKQPVIYASTNNKSEITRLMAEAKKDLKKLSGKNYYIFVTDSVEDRRIYNF